MRVLLVEDDPMIGATLAAALKDASYATDWVQDGLAALTTLDCQHYDRSCSTWPARQGRLEVLASLRARAITRCPCSSSPHAMAG